MRGTSKLYTKRFFSSSTILLKTTFGEGEALRRRIKTARTTIKASTRAPMEAAMMPKVPAEVPVALAAVRENRRVQGSNN